MTNKQHPKIIETTSFGNPAYKCQKWGFTEFKRLSFSKFKTHVEECDGYNKPHHRFVKGQIVQLSRYGQKSLNKDQTKTYKVVDIAEKCSHTIKVKSLDYEKTTNFAHLYLNPINTTLLQQLRLELKRKLPDLTLTLF